jgi:putative chitinase
MIPIDASVLSDMLPANRSGRIAGAIAPHLSGSLNRHGIDTGLRVAHFLAQTAHESDGFATLEEYADGSAYEGRIDLGNTRPGDGARYKGRGLIQLTGRANYRRIGALLGLDLEADPETAASPAIAVETAAAYWRERGLNTHADRDDPVAVTFAVNGGLNGLRDRRCWLARAKAALFGLPAPRPHLREGDAGPAVASLQYALGQAGHPVAVDGRFGPATLDALADFQQAHSLAADGISGPQSWAALASSRLASVRTAGEKRFMPLVKRSLSLAGHRTSLSLEPEFWDAIDRAAAEDDRSLAGLIGEIDAARGEEPLASSVRVWVLRRLTAAG